MWEKLRSITSIGRTSTFPTNQHISPCRSCRRLRSFDLAFKNQSQHIAAFGSSYRSVSVLGGDFVVIQCAVHREFGEHDDLLDR
ncbi:hypothetical protein EJA70_24225 [Pseudomonas sp. PB103]|nr:hypothetical protein EJA70_24225 [Pseudomonas sp. PB103]